MQLTTGMLWLGAALFAMADIPLVLFLAHRISASRFQAIGRLVIAVTAVFWSGLWFWVVTVYWEAVYAYVFPSWSRWYLPVFQAVLTAAFAALAIRLAQRTASRPVLSYCLLGGVWGALTHLWALLRGITTRPPPLQGTHPLAVIVIAFFEFIFYWCVILILAVMLQSIIRHMMKRSALLQLLLLATVTAIVACRGGRLPDSSRQSPPPSPQPLSRALETKRSLETTDAPQRDLIDLVARFSDGGQSIPKVARHEPWAFALGDEHDFWLQDKETGDYHRVTAELRQATAHAYWFVVEGLALNEGALGAAAEQFETAIYPTNQRFFGREWTPGVDSDPRLVILLAGELGDGVSAYQDSLDELPQAVFPYSNEMEMITLSGVGARLDGPAFACDLAHEYQHVIQWAVDRDEATWLNETFGLLACPLNDLEADYQDFIVEAFAAQPGVQLNTWETEPEKVAAQYGASQLFGAYFLERFGEQAVQLLAADSLNGLHSVDSALRTLGAGLDGDELFANWVVANYLDNPDLAGGRYGYRDLELPAIQPQRVIDAGTLPVELEATVGQYAADYFALHGPGEFQIDFRGEALVRPVPAEPHSGDMVWWAGREQESDVTLSHDFDLGGLERATLTFYTWYDIEANYHYAYVAVSTDGRQWTALPGQTTSVGASMGIDLGPGYTGRSDGWVQERIDLTPYAGQRVQVRFEYVTDDGPIRPGFLLDDIEIPELGYHHDAESDDGGWLADGFLRLANSLPQEWLLQLITHEGDQVGVERLSLGSENSGRWTISLGQGETAVLAISGLTRGTAEAAGYKLMVSGPGG